MSKDIYDIFAEQIAYNKNIRFNEPEKDGIIGWTKTYLLGLVSEIDEVLREIDWKRHRKLDIPRKFDKTSMAMELTDLTKYILSLWELWGFTAEDILYYVGQKNEILFAQYDQEFEDIPKDRPIVITDLDGTVADWRWSFMHWINSKGIKTLTLVSETSMAMDTDLLLRFPDYYELKEDFEREGGYRSIIVYEDSASLLRNLKLSRDAYIIAVTARPADKYKRIWMDTWNWIKENDLPIDKLIITSEPRLLLADKLNKTQKVIMLEDDPGLILRAANAGIKVFVKRHRYNENIVNGNVIILNSYTDLKIDQYLENQ